MAKLLTLLFSHFFLLKLAFFCQKSHSPCRKKKKFLKNSKKQKRKKTIKKRWPSYWLMMAKLLTPTAHIWIRDNVVRACIFSIHDGIAHIRKIHLIFSSVILKPHNGPTLPKKVLNRFSVLLGGRGPKLAVVSSNLPDQSSESQGSSRARVSRGKDNPTALFLKSPHLSEDWPIPWGHLRPLVGHF